MAESLLDRLTSKLDLSDEQQRKLAVLAEKYRSLDDAGKVEFLSMAKEKLKQQLGGDRYDGFRTFAPFLAGLLIVCVLVFFGYKLYKSLSERERKREEKKKNKQMKKKK